MKALEGANTEARVQVAEARNRGDVGEAEKQVNIPLQSTSAARAMHFRDARQ